MSDPTEPGEAGLPADQEPVTTGTLVILMLFLMALGALWGLMYLVLLER